MSSSYKGSLLYIQYALLTKDVLLKSLKVKETALSVKKLENKWRGVFDFCLFVHYFLLG